MRRSLHHPEKDIVISVWKRTRIVLGILALVIVVAIVESYLVFYGPNNFEGGGEKAFFVSRGEPFSAVVDSLVEQGIVRDRERFLFVARIYGGTQHVRIGKYLFASGISNVDLYLSLRSGRGSTLISVTIPEGLRARSQAHLLARVIGIDSARYVALANDESFTRSLDIDAPTLEGYLFPETYHCTWEQDEKDVIRMMVEQGKRFFNDTLQARAKEFGWTERQALTLASIIEGEALRNDERAMISGVYHNRLRRGMLLEADPTIQYILEDGPRRVLYTDLQIDDPYNTYRYKGLPPGPVSNPGRASILAALYPAQNPYLYFVANGKGGHWFSSTFEEHTMHVRMYRRQRAKTRALSAAQQGNVSPRVTE